MVIEITQEIVEVTSKETSNAKKAQAFFISASMRTPASVTAQAAIIAEFCRQDSLDPRILKDNLLSREDLLINILEKANHKHQTAGKGPQNVTMEELRKIISGDFQFAALLTKLTDSQLQEIYSLKYIYHYRGEGSSYALREKRFKNEVISMLEKLTKK